MLNTKLIAAVAAILGVLLSVMGGAVTGYTASRTDVATLVGRLNEHEMRLNMSDRTLELYHKEQLDYQSEMRAAVSHAIDMLTDVRTNMARGHHG